MAQADRAHDVFISYSTKDQAIADSVCGFLEARQIRCWMAPRDILPGQPYAQVIIDAISQCKVFVLIFSAQSSQSQDVLQETDNAKNKKKVIIPFRIDDTRLEGNPFEYYLTIRQWIDGMPHPENAFAMLADAIMPHLAASEDHPAGEDPKMTAAVPSADRGSMPPADCVRVVEGKVKTYSRNQILTIAKLQCKLFCFLLVSILLYIPCFFIRDDGGIALTLFGAYLGGTILNIIAYSRLSMVTGENFLITIISVFLMISPCANQLILITETIRSRKILRAAGVKTSFWGVPKSEIARFESGRR